MDVDYDDNNNQNKNEMCVHVSVFVCFHVCTTIVQANRSSDYFIDLNRIVQENEQVWIKMRIMMNLGNYPSHRTCTLYITNRGVFGIGPA